MSELDDHQLLAEFARTHSEAAFASLVQRHVNLVYSVALRGVGNVHVAQEISQAVFIILAQRAGKISPKIILSGWLYQTTRLTAANFRRGEIRRQQRESEAYMQSTLNEPEAANVWPQIAPLLDDALAKLGERDRNAIVLRFFENKNLREVGAALGASEDAAKMRVNRALEKLRKMFGKRGISLTTAIIAGAVSANSVQAAPAGLAATVTAAAAKGVVISGSTLTLIKGVLKIMAWSNTKVAIVAGIGVLLAGGASTVIVEKLITPASFIRIEGKGQIELYDYYGNSRVVETGNLIILTDGKSYRISIASESHSGLTNDVYDMNADYGCDGMDVFMLSDQISPFHRTHDGLGGFAYSGRFPNNEFIPPSLVDAAWLAYCSKDYFNASNHQTGFRLFGDYSMVWPGFITNQVTYWTNSTLPQSITGWSRNWIIGDRTNSNQPKQAVELEQYPNGFKAWKFTANDPVMVGNIHVPRQITLETFFPKPPDTATTGDETLLLRKATFTVDSVEIGKGRFRPLPPVTVPDLQIVDWRFKDLAGNFVIGSHATPQGWPVRGSKAFKQAAAEANKITLENRALIQSELKKEAQIIPPT